MQGAARKEHILAVGRTRSSNARHTAGGNSNSATIQAHPISVYPALYGTSPATPTSVPVVHLLPVVHSHPHPFPRLPHASLQAASGVHGVGGEVAIVETGWRLCAAVFNFRLICCARTSAHSRALTQQ